MIIISPIFHTWQSYNLLPVELLAGAKFVYKSIIPVCIEFISRLYEVPRLDYLHQVIYLFFHYSIFMSHTFGMRGSDEIYLQLHTPWHQKTCTQLYTFGKCLTSVCIEGSFHVDD